MNDQGYIKNLPQKRMASGVVIFNEFGEVLLVKPTYKNHWSVPGGVIDKDESPRDAAIRETKEEINIELKKCDLLCIDYMSPRDSGFSTKDENMQFIFYGGILSNEEINQIQIPKEEIGEFGFFSKDESLKQVGEKLSNRLPACYEAIDTKIPVYLEGGRKIN
ncbi:MAG: NUDIX hydrolase [uncultured bacterium]|nr:MAG: NUDIX hydrolase [uncultured bacterium]